MKPRWSRNRILLVVGLLGFILAIWLHPISEDDFTPPDLPALSEDRSLPLPPIGARDDGFNPIADPFLFQLGDTGKLTGIQREGLLKSQYQKILSKLDGSVPEVTVDNISDMTVVLIDDKPFATVLPTDLPEYYEQLSEEKKKQLERMVAERWARLLLSDLAFESFRRSPSHLAGFPYTAAACLFLALMFHALADVFARRYLHSPGWSLKAFVWLTTLSICALLHPFLAPLARPMLQGGVFPIFYFLLVLTLCNVLYRFGIRALERYVQAFMAGRGETSLPRLQQRVETMSQGGRFLIGTLVAVFGIMAFLGALGIDLGKLFAGAGIVGVALGVVGKDILLDYISGINILADDLFSIGDYIETPVASGTVESFNLRMTRIRETDGGLSMVTNGMLTQVKNHSREFANADFRVGVAYGSDTDRCMELILEEIKKLSEERPEVLDPAPSLKGVHELGDSAVVLRALVKTAALQQWEVGRELNRRVLHRFGKEGIDIPFPQHTVWLKNPATPSSHGLEGQ